MKKWLAVGVVVALAIAGAAVMFARHRSPTSSTVPSAPERDPVIEEFRAGERTCISAFNAALARQRANQIDELGLADAIEKDVLTPWRELRRHVEAATPPPGRAELYTTLRHYLEARQTAWEAYAAGLRAGSDVAARPHYDVYHQKNTEADSDARELGRMFRTQ